MLGPGGSVRSNFSVLEFYFSRAIFFGKNFHLALYFFSWRRWLGLLEFFLQFPCAKNFFGN